MVYFDCVKQKVNDITNNDSQSVAHRMDHIERVLNNVEEIAANYPKVDMELLKIAVLLHDVNQPYNRKREHVKLSINTGHKILEEIGYPPEKIKDITQIINEHSSEHIETIKPRTIEAKILFDADKLDGISASGIARVFALFGQNGKEPIKAIPWYLNKIKISMNNMQTKEGKAIAELRLKYVMEFIGKIVEENNL